MHEYGICAGIVEAVEDRAHGRKVARVRVRIGTLRRVVEPAFQQAFTASAMGTVAEDAKFEIVVMPARARCRSCNKEMESQDSIPACPHCGGVDLEFTGGEELMLESLEYAATGGGG